MIWHFFSHVILVLFIYEFLNFQILDSSAIEWGTKDLKIGLRGNTRLFIFGEC